MALCCCVFSTNLKSAANFIGVLSILVALIELLFDSFALKHQLWGVADLVPTISSGITQRLIFFHIIVMAVTIVSAFVILCGLRYSLWYLWLPWFCSYMIAVVLNVGFCLYALLAVKGKKYESDVLTHGVLTFIAFEVFLIVLRTHWIVIMVMLYGKLYPEEDKKKLLESSSDEGEP